MSTIADYNNNPGNIKPPKGVTYDGQIGVDDRGFAVFENKDYGRKALVGDIEIKLKNGMTSPEAFINKYAPAGKENDENARMNYKIFLADQLGMKSTSDKFPENSAHKIADAIAHYESGTRPEQITSPTVPALPVTDNPENKASQPSIAPPDQVPPPAQLNPLFGMIPGARYGVGAGTALAIADAKLNAASGAKEAWDALLGRNAPAPVAPPTATVAPPIAPAPVVEPVQAATSPKHGGQNWVKSLTNVDLPNGQMAKADLDLAKGMQTAVGIKGEPGFTGGKITQGGVIINPQTASAIDAQKTQAQKSADKIRLMREAQARIAAQAAEQSKAAEAAMLARGEGQAVQAATHAPTSSPLMQYVKRVASFPVKGALAGAGAGFSVIDALNRFNQRDEKGNRDISGAALSGLGGAAGVAAPFVASMGALPAASIALPLYLSVDDRIKYLKKHPEAQQLIEEEYDPMGNRQR